MKLLNFRVQLFFLSALWHNGRTIDGDLKILGLNPATVNRTEMMRD